MHNQFHSTPKTQETAIVARTEQLTTKDIRLLEDHLQENEKARKYHLSLGITVVFFSWFWYFALPGIAGLIWAIVASVWIWIYPYIFSKKVKGLKAALLSQEKKQYKNIQIEDKKKVAISRLHHEYKLTLNGEKYTASQYIFNSFQPNMVVDIEVAVPANIILTIKKVK